MEKILEKAHYVDLPDNMYEPLDNTNHSWSVVEKKITSFGLKFVPTIRRHDSPKKLTDFMEFVENLNSLYFFIIYKKAVALQTEIKLDMTMYPTTKIKITLMRMIKNLGSKKVHLIRHWVKATHLKNLSQN